MSTEDVIIVGAGPAGLACAAALRAQGRGSVILEAADQVAASWRHHYDRLRLHTSKVHSSLPGQAMPEGFPRYPSRLQVIEYLEGYARDHKLCILPGRRVAVLQKTDEWIVRTSDGEEFKSQFVIIATGLSRDPHRPDWRGKRLFGGRILHSSEYRNAMTLGGSRILVVGFGNSAGEIALECALAGYEVALSVRGAVNVVPREIFGIPSATIAIAQRKLPHKIADWLNAPALWLRYRDLDSFGLKRSPMGPLRTMIERGRTPLIDIGTIARIRDRSIKVFPAIDSSDKTSVLFEDGRSFECDTIVLATGYRPALAKLLPDADRRFGGFDKPRRGDLNPGGDGLYFCGFNAATSGLLRQIGIEAVAIASAIGGQGAPDHRG